MNEKKKKILKVIKIVIAIAFCIGAGAIAFFPFNNRNLNIEVTTNQGVLLLEKTSTEILSEESTVLEFDNVDLLKIEQIKIFGNFQSMYLKKIGNPELLNYILEVSGAEMSWADEQIVFQGQNRVCITLNELFEEAMQELSASFLQERIVMLEILLVFCALILIICKVVEERTSKSNHGPVYEVKRFVGDIKKYGQYMIYAAKTDLNAEVANSYLNRLWWLLEPLFSMLVYVLVFGRVMGNSVENYATFIFSTLLMWNFFNKTINYSVKLVRNNREIVTKVYIPKFVLLLSNMILNLFKLFFSMIILVVMLIIFRVEIGINILWMIPAYVGLMLLAFGAGMIFLHFGVYVDDLSYAVGILLNMLMYLSGIFYEVMTTLPAPLNTLMMCVNPVAMYLDTMRNALLYNTASNLPILGIWLVISLILSCIGVHIVYKNENGYVKVV